ncbi:MAG: glycosyltransferase family 4 protein [Halobacteriaceae archaeon]
MRVLNYLELAGRLERAGIGTAAAQQRQALAPIEEVEVLTQPWAGDGPGDLARQLLRGRVFTEYDIAHCNMIGPGSVAVARHARHRGHPLVLHAHVTAEDFAESFRGSTQIAPVLHRYLRWFYNQADLVLCPSEYTKRTLQEYPVATPIETITNGVDLDSIEGHESLRDRYRDRFDLDGVVVFAVGNVFERKGLTTFCKTAERTDLDFAWFGTYDTGPQASSTVRQWVNNPPENVTFTGWVEDKRGAFGAGDIFLFPTKVENQGLVVLEAMAAGKAVVVRDIPVFEEFFTDGEDCLKCETTAEFVDAVERLAADPELRDALGTAAQETAAAHSLDRVGEELTRIYRDLLTETPTA